MPKNGKQNGKRSQERVMLGVWIDSNLRKKGQVAVRILNYDDMTDFIEAKLKEAIDQAEKRYATK